MSPNLFACTVTCIERVAQDTLHIAAACGQLAREARPGQFVMLRAGAGLDPLLRRPFSICEIDDPGVSFLVKVCGKGTALMSQWRCGDVIDVLGPLGNGFSVDNHIRQAVLVGGGIGVAPLIGLARHCVKHRPGTNVRLYMGAGNAASLISHERFGLGTCEVHIATDDGSAGFHGTVAELVAQHLQERILSAGSGVCLYGCGPSAMSRQLASWADTNGIDCRLSLESRMACGTGACLGCVVPASGGDAAYRRVCADGPVFDSTAIDWDRLP